MPLSKLDNKKALLHLKKDKILKKIIEEYDIHYLQSETNLFESLVETIISQQLSGKAAETIYNRFKVLFTHSTSSGQANKLTPQNILKIKDEKIRECGISYPKIKYIKGLCKAIVDGSFAPDKVQNLSDEEVIAELTKLKGIGRWTAEMILIFSLKRPDVFSVGDLGLRTAVSKLYNINRENIKEIGKLSLKWAPYRSFAARYLWRSLNNRELEFYSFFFFYISLFYLIQLIF